MRSERREVKGVLSLGTLLRFSVVSGLAIGEMFGVFAGVSYFMAGGGAITLVSLVLLAPPATALLLALVTLIGHPLYVVLVRFGIPGLDRISFEAVKE